MRNAETVLHIIQQRGRRGQPVADVYRQLYNPDLYLRAYGRIYRKEGAMTRGATAETVDGMSQAKIAHLIAQLRQERYRWTPVRRRYIPKKQPGKRRPLGLPTWSDKLVQEVVRSILNAYFEPQFSDHAHGFRPQRGCHTALRTIQGWSGTHWFIEGDIEGCYDNIDHAILLSMLQQHFPDNRFLRLVKHLLQAGYLEEWKHYPTFSGTPQGGLVSPILSNIYLDRLDRFVENTLLPYYNRGIRRRANPAYRALQQQRAYWKKKGDGMQSRALRQAMQQIPSMDTTDPTFRRLHYVRYADDFLLGFTGPKREAEDIKAVLKAFLQQELGLKLSEDKTLVTHAQTGTTRFLGYEIQRFQDNTKRDASGRRSINHRISLRIPAEVVQDRCRRYRKQGVIQPRLELTNDHDYTIVQTYQDHYRGVVQYYALAHNVGALRPLRWTLETSLLKTLAVKHKSRVRQIARRYRSTTQTPAGPRRCYEVRVARQGKKPLIARFGGLSLKRKQQAFIKDRRIPPPGPTARTELVQRLLADTCEVCGSSQQCQVHHVRKLADLKVNGRKEKPPWIRLMAARRRKTLVVCRACHVAIHAGKMNRDEPLVDNGYWKAV